ncbi:MAG: SO_0444 family Cu/Zn efflux transporter [Planctomycetota bacterium]
MDRVIELINPLASSTFDLALKTAPWLLFGLVFAGVIRAWLPERALVRWLGGGKASVVRAALIGAPLPLCSCGVVPAAIGLRRAGASDGSTVAFLVSTPENGADSVALSWALLGPVMAVARVVSALVCAIGAGLLTMAFAKPATLAPAGPVGLTVGASDESEHSSCGCSAEPSCCSDEAATNHAPGAMDRLGEGVHYAMSKLLGDLAPWLVFGLVVSGAILAYVPSDALASWGSGPLAMVVFAVVGVPMYVCAAAATPVAAGLIAVGVGPGAALVFLLAGPATNLGTVGLVRKEMGAGALVAYLAGVVPLSIACGLTLDAVLFATGWTVTPDAGGGSAGAHIGVPAPIAFGCLLVLVVFAIGPVRRRLVRFAE